jgi:hypothetical protein
MMATIFSDVPRAPQSLADATTLIRVLPTTIDVFSSTNECPWRKKTAKQSSP